MPNAFLLRDQGRWCRGPTPVAPCRVPAPYGDRSAASGLPASTSTANCSGACAEAPQGPGKIGPGTRPTPMVVDNHPYSVVRPARHSTRPHPPGDVTIPERSRIRPDRCMPAVNAGTHAAPRSEPVWRPVPRGTRTHPDPRRVPESRKNVRRCGSNEGNVPAVGDKGVKTPSLLSARRHVAGTPSLRRQFYRRACSTSNGTPKPVAARKYRFPPW